MNWIKKLWSKGDDASNPQETGGALSPAYGLDLQSPEEFINRANKRAVKGDLKGAIADFDAAIDLNPAKATAFYNRGYLHNLAGHHQQAIIDCSDAIALLPDYDEAFYQRGIAHQDLGDIDAAIVDFTEVLRLNPYSIKTYYKRAKCYSTKNDVQGAVADYTQAILRVPKDANAYLQRGLCLTQMQEYRTAVEDFSSALSFNPKNAEAYYHRGYCYAELGDKEKATQDFNQAMLYDPNHRAASSQRDHALGILKTSRNLPPASSDAPDLPRSQNETVWLEDAEPLVFSLDPSAPDMESEIDQPEMRSAAELQERFTSGRESQRPVGDHRPLPAQSPGGYESGRSENVEIPQAQTTPAQANIDQLFARAQRSAEQGQVDDAIAIYSQIIECQPENTQAYVERGKNFESLGNTDAAVADMDAALYWTKQKSLDLMKDYSGSISQTLADLKQSLAKPKTQDSSSAIVPLASNQSIEGAILQNSQAIHRNPLDPKAYFERAKSRALLGDLEGAIDDYTRTIALDENFCDAYYKRGLLLGALGDVEGATQDMNKAIRRKPMLSASGQSPAVQAPPVTVSAVSLEPDSESKNEISSPEALELESNSRPHGSLDNATESSEGLTPPVESEISLDVDQANLEVDPSDEDEPSLDDNITQLLQEQTESPVSFEPIESSDIADELKSSELVEQPSDMDQKLTELLHQNELDELLADSDYESFEYHDSQDPNSGPDAVFFSTKPAKSRDVYSEGADFEPTVLLNHADLETERDEDLEIRQDELESAFGELEIVEESAIPPDELADKSADFDPTLLLNRPSAALVEELALDDEQFSTVASEIAEDPTIVLSQNQPNDSAEIAESSEPSDSIPENFNAFSRQTWVSPSGKEGASPSFFSDLVMEPCTHEGNNPENRFCIHCGQEIRPTL